MRVMKVLCLFLLVGMTAAMARGQMTPGMTPSPAPVPDQPAKEVIPAVELQVIPGDKVGNISLDDMLDYLKDKVPGFNGVVVRSQSTAKDYPMIPQMTLKNVTVGQFMELLKFSFPGVSIKRFDNKGPAGAPLYLVFVDNPTLQPNAFGGGVGMPVAAPLVPAPMLPVVKVYRLTEILATMDGDPKQKMDDVLSLVQAALDETGGDNKPKPFGGGSDNNNQAVLKLHQPTQTLVFKGMPDKMEVLEQVLDSLRPKESDTVKGLDQEVQRWKEEAMGSQEKFRELTQKSRDDRAKIEQMDSQLMATQLELEATRNQLRKNSTTKP